MLAALSTGDAIALAAICVSIVGSLGAAGAWVISRVDRATDKNHDEILLLRHENAEQHTENGKLLNKLEDTIQHHIAVDHAKIIEAMTRFEERQASLIERADDWKLLRKRDED